MTLNNAQKTASSLSVKTILGKTFAGSPVNACPVEPESVLKNENLIKMSILHAPVIRRDSIPSLCQRFVLILRVCFLKILLFLFFRNVLIFGLRSCFVIFGRHKPSFVLVVLPYFLSYRRGLSLVETRASNSLRVTTFASDYSRWSLVRVTCASNSPRVITA